MVDESVLDYIETETDANLEPWVYVEDKVVDLELEEDYEKRIKQVLMNLQSNAIKFTKENGKITIICEYVRASKATSSHYRKLKNSNSYYFESFSGESDGSRDNNDENDGSDDKKKMEGIFKPDQTHDKIIISVLDTGIGIKAEDKRKLFKLFGTVSTTR